ncbi:recombinase family protein [Nodosilinea sp. AN01ver1]|uniref:recombinase family protein n=1 Tax=Nodosilinea sp. AN01ver1 TaxID=3423362 RepID=UPI003D31F57F
MNSNLSLQADLVPAIRSDSNVNKSHTHPIAGSMLILGYARVSTKHLSQATSIPNQVARLEAYGCHKVWKERASSGDSDRSEFQDMIAYAMKAAKSQSVCIVVSERERLWRNLEEQMIVLQHLYDHGIEFHDLAGKIEIHEPEGRLTTHILGAAAEFQRNLTIKKVKRQKAEARDQGLPLGKPPFGYQLSDDKRQLEPDPNTWNIAKEIVNRYLQGEGLHRISSWLLKTHGIKRDRASISRWLDSPKISGHQRYIITEKDGTCEKWVYNTHKALVTPEIEKSIIQRKKNNKAHCGNNQPLYAVSGIVHCKSCEVGINWSNQKEFRYGRCKGKFPKKCPHSGTVRADRVEQAIITAICLRADEIAEAILPPKGDRPDPEILKLEQQIQKKKQFHKENGGDGLEQDIWKLETELAHMRNQIDARHQNNERNNEVIQMLAQPTFWDGMSEQDRNLIYKDLGIVVWVRGREIVSVEL